MPIVFGLLQTENYAHAVLKESLLFKDDELAHEQVKLRMQRQWQVLERSDPPKLHVLLGERALHHRVGGTEVLREQLLHLANVITQPNIALQIVPADYWELPFLTDPGTCFLFNFDDPKHKDAIYEESAHPGAEIRRSDNAVELQYWSQAFKKIACGALSLNDSRKLIIKRTEALLRGKE